MRSQRVRRDSSTSRFCGLCVSRRLQPFSLRVVRSLVSFLVIESQFHATVLREDAGNSLHTLRLWRLALCPSTRLVRENVLCVLEKNVYCGVFFRMQRQEHTKPHCCVVSLGVSVASLIHTKPHCCVVSLGVSVASLLLWRVRPLVSVEC